MAARRTFWLVCCLAGFGAISALQQEPYDAGIQSHHLATSYRKLEQLRSPAAQNPRPPLPPSLGSSMCTDFVWQQIALTIFHLLTGGSNWTNRSGWPEALGAAALSTTACHRNYNGVSVSLPPFCCWFGVFCCLSSKCGLHNELLIDACNCSVGSVTGLSLPHNNLVGSLDGSYTDMDNSTQGVTDISVVEILSLLSCTLRGLGLQNNQLSGGLPESLTMLSQLRTLNLGYNNLNGTLPATLGNMTAFNVLELTNNKFSGPIPRDLCSQNGTSPLTDLFLGNNLLTGALDISNCRQLILVDATNNVLSGSLPNISGYPLLHIVHLAGNEFSGSITGTFDTLLFTGILVTDLNLARNSLTGTIPESLADLIYLTSLNLHTNNLTGTLPSDLFALLGTMTSLDASNNSLTGTIPPSIGQASSLISLDLSNNALHGVIPDGLVAAMGATSNIVDMRETNVSCCGVNFVRGTGMYQRYNYSQPLLPKGLAMSSTLRSVSSATADSQRLQGLSCPYLYNSLLSDDSPDGLLISWLVEPQYYLYVNCTCTKGFVLTNLSVYGEPNITCRVPQQSPAPWWESMPYIWVIITLVPALLFMALTWCCIFRRGSRPVILQNFIDMRKRLRGFPQNGETISIVVTDIEGFSNLMSRAPQLTTDALMIHNHLIRKTKWLNFGFTIEQEGDSYSVAFHEAVDAVKFCLQAQQLLARQSWPEGLFSSKESSLPSSKGLGSAKLKRAGTIIMSGIVSGINWINRSTDTPPDAPGPGSRPSELQSQYNKSLKDMYQTSEVSSRQSGLHCVTSPSQVELTVGEVEVWPRPPSGSAAAAPPLCSSATAREAALRESLEGASSARSGKALEEQRKAFFAHGAYARARSAHVGLESVQLDGLRVRMGIATGMLPLRTAAAASTVMESAKVICDAAAGGQVLMCSSSFHEVQHMCEELGCVDHNGTNLAQLNAQRAPWWFFGKRRRKEKQEAVLLNMGHYVLCPKGPSQVPLILSTRYLGQQRSRAPAPGPGAAQAQGAAGAGPEATGLPPVHVTLASGRAVTAPPRSASACRLGGGGGGAAGAAPMLHLASIYQDEPSEIFEPLPAQRLELHQLLPPSLVARGRVFGSHLGLKEEWVALDVPYFSAPGAMYAPLNSSDVAVSGLDLPLATIVFCMVDGGKQYTARYRQDAMTVHLEMQALVRSVLRQIPGGYFVKEQDGEMKYMLAFRHPAAALMWCLAVQECALYVEWPESALRQWPEECDSQRLLFRGPRLKMGVCDGPPHSILPDYLGRADYCGYSVNQAARFMDAAAHGGQVACEECLFHQAAACWNQPEVDMFQCFAVDSWAPGDLLPDAPGSQHHQRSSGPGSEARPVPSVLSPPTPAARQQPSAAPAPQDEKRYEALSRQLVSGWTGGHAVSQASVNGFGQLETWLEQDEGADLHLVAAALPPAPKPLAASAGEAGAVDDPAGSRAGARADSPTAAAAAAAAGNEFGDLHLRARTFCSATGAAGAGAEAAPVAVTGRQIEVQAIRLGTFNFKGSMEPSSMVAVTSAALSGRRFPLEPPRGKGSRMCEASGVCAEASMPALNVVDRYRKHYELLCRLRATNPDFNRGMMSPRSERSGRPGIQRSWASLRAKSQSFLRRSATGSVKSGDRSPSSPAAPFGEV